MSLLEVVAAVLLAVNSFLVIRALRQSETPPPPAKRAPRPRLQKQTSDDPPYRRAA